MEGEIGRSRWLLRVLQMLSHVTAADHPLNVIEYVLSGDFGMYVDVTVMPFTEFPQ